MKNSYSEASQRYGDFGVDTEKVLQRLLEVPISLQCWQGDDVRGFEQSGDDLTGGIQATGNYPGKARTPQELRADLDVALSLIPGSKRVNLHACYAELNGKKIARNEYTIDHFKKWVAWAKAGNLGIDFNGTFFSHPLSSDGYTLSHSDPKIRQFWIEHGIASRKIAADIGKALGKTVITNLWIPDGSKDTTMLRGARRQWLAESLDSVFAEKIDPALNRDAVESKLFGIGLESFTVGSHEFYMGYAVSRGKMICLDAGHFHPMETLSDKVSALMTFVPEILFHVSRGVRWDSDHVVILDDPTRSLMEEIVRGGYLDRVHIGLDFFDASINRIAAWVVGARSTQKALLFALLEPQKQLSEFEAAGDFGSRLALLEECKSLPFGAVWDEFCRRQNVPVSFDWMKKVKTYEREVLQTRK